ncbi:MAG: hypothetical protein IJH65_03790 [Methanobrevibacter sp.]|nr:hypothetical protein [Methanobrevibacter sp.]
MKRDLEEYLIALQKQRDEMAKAADEANSLLLEGKIDSEQANAIQTYFNTIEVNYQRVLYCRYLYKLPPKFIQKIQQKKIHKELMAYMEKNADKESVIKENEECLKKVGEITND